jgi:hypothetical protein
MVIVFEEFRHIKTIDYLLDKAEDQEKVIFLIQTHPTILNPYFEIGCLNRPIRRDHFLDLSDWPQTPRESAS